MSVYRITQLHNDKDSISTFSTIDAAITEARKLTKLPAEYIAVVVRDGARVRVRAKEGRAHWVVPCKPCKGAGKLVSPGGPQMWSSGYETCPTCHGTGSQEDLLCQ